MKAQAPKEKKDAVELRGRPQEEVLNEIQALVPKNETRWLSFSFSPLARGEIEIKHTKRGLRGDGFLSLRNPALPTRDLGLHLRVRSRRITGSLAFRAGKGYLDFHRLNSILKRHPLALGIKGVEVISRPKIKNRLTSQGELEFSATNVKLKIQKAFLGSLDLSLTDQGPRVTRAQARLDFKKIAKVEMELLPRKDGYLTGKVQTDVTLGKAAGKGEFVWDEKGLQAGGELGYQDEKFDGKVRLKVASADRAKALLADKVPRWRPLHQPYAVFAEGTLTFHFTDWLTGSAQVIIDPWGHFTVCGEITPQAEIELFAQKDFRRELPPLEARASYGIPVIGNVFLFIGLGLELWATVGPAKFYNIKVSGQYSTDPEVAKDFRIQGSLNISAAAGIDARIEGGAGVEIADHDVKAGVGLTGRAGIKGYAEATPIVGYREQPETGKGEFFISGELEIGAQPFLGLSGDFFIEVDSPWWSPLGDKEWRWPFLNKEWPLPGTFAVKAKVDYVFGSGKWPEIEFGKVDFDPQKFASDLVHRRVKSGRGERKTKGRWQEKNKPQAKPPPKAEPAGRGPGKGPKARKTAVPRKRRFRTPRKRARAPARLRALRRQALRRRKVKRPRPDVEKKLAKRRREKEIPRDPRKAQVLAAVKAAFAREKKPLPLGRVYALARKLKRRYRLKRVRVVVRGRRFQVWVAQSKEKKAGEGDVKEIQLFGYKLKDGPKDPDYQIRGDTLVFKTFFLPKAKYHSRKGDFSYLEEYTKRAINVDVTHPKKQKRAQRKNWEKGLSEEALENIKNFLNNTTGKENNRSLALLNKIEECQWHIFPDWDENGRSTSFEVDHIIELAVGGKDHLENYVLFDSRANRSSGGTFGYYFRAMRKIVSEQNLNKVKLEKAAGKEPKEGGGNVSKGPIWTKKEIAAGKHIKRCLKNEKCYQNLIRRIANEQCNRRSQ